MPSATTRHTMSRQWELLKQIPSRGPGKSANQLTTALRESGFKVSKRQVERDLNVLMESFPIEHVSQHTRFLWRWVPGASTNLPGLSLAEAVSLHLIEETLRPLLPASVIRAVEPRLRQARNHLASLRNLSLARWADKVRSISPMLPMQPPHIDPAILEQVQMGLLDERQLEVTYRGMETQVAKTLILHPLALVQRGPVTYLLATAFDYDDLRLYALQRMTAAEILPNHSHQPEGFSLDTYIANGGFQFVSSNQPIPLELAVNPVIARILEETPLEPDQTLERKDTHTLVRARVADSWQLRWWLLSLGDSVEVLEPVGLRKEMAAILTRAHERYQCSET